MHRAAPCSRGLRDHCGECSRPQGAAANRLSRAFVRSDSSMQRTQEPPSYGSRIARVDFEEVRSRILGALLDAVVAGLGNLPAVTLDQLPRMANFAIWVSACEKALGLETGEALEAYRANCAEARKLALEASPVYEPLREVARAGFSGPSSELLLLFEQPGER
jgi:hypothetical protein